MIKSMKIVLRLIIIFYVSTISSVFSYETTHTYDSLNRLVKTVSIDGDKTNTIEYSYDDPGNMTNVTTTVEGGVELTVLVSQFGQSECVNCKADLDGDGTVDGLDIIAFINQ